MKRLLSVVLAVVLLISSMMNITVLADDTSAHIEFLVNMGAIEKDFDAASTVTRGEFVALLMKLLYKDIDYELVDKSVSPFNDLYSDNEYFSYIKAAKDIKVINGDTYNNFYADREITVTEAVVMIINAYSYTYIANAKGGYPTGYLTVANQINMLKGVEVSDTPSGDTLLKLIYNSLFADVISIDSITSDGSFNISIVEGVDMLSHRFNLVKYTGIVVDNGITSLEGTSLNYDDKVVIKLDDGSTLTAYISDKEILNHLGSKVDAYVKYNNDNGRYELIYFNLKSLSDEVVISAQQITDVKTGYVEYEKVKDSGNFVKLNLETSATKVIYNGHFVSVRDLSIYQPDSGSLRFIDTNDDGKYDVVDIISFNYRATTDSDNDGAIDDPGLDRYGYIHHDNDTWNIVVDTVDVENGFITSKVNPLVNNISIDEEKSIVRFVLNSSVKSYEDIETGDIISVALSPSKVDGKDVYYLAVSKEEVSGKIASYTDETIILENGDEYRVSSAIRSTYRLTTNFNIENSYAVDIMGEITYIYQSSVLTKNYGYLIGAKVANTYENELYVKMFTKGGTVTHYYGADKMTIDGVSVTGGASQLAAISRRDTSASKFSADTSISRPVIFKLNGDDKIISIDTDYPNYTGGTTDMFYANMSPIKYTEEEVIDEAALKAGLRYTRYMAYKTALKTFDGRVYLDANTVILSVPDIDTYALNSSGADNAFNYIRNNVHNIHFSTAADYDFVKLYENDASENSNYKVLTLADLNTAVQYDAQVYDVDPDTGVASLVVLRGNDAVAYQQNSKTNDIYVFLRMTEAYDTASEKTVNKIYYTKDGITEESALVDKDELFEYFKYIVYGATAAENIYGYSVEPLKAGDFIRVSKNGNKLTYIDRVLTMNKTIIENVWASLNVPSIPRFVYARDDSFTYSTQPYDIYDVNRLGNTTYPPVLSTANYHILMPRSVNGNLFSAYLGQSTLGGVNPSDYSSYIIQYFDMTDKRITVVDVKTDGTIKVKAGTVNDIKMGDNPSIVFLLESSYNVSFAYVINFE